MIDSKGIELDYNGIHKFKYFYNSDVELNSIYVQLVKNPNMRVDGIDEARITPKLTSDSKSG